MSARKASAPILGPPVTAAVARNRPSLMPTSYWAASIPNFCSAARCRLTPSDPPRRSRNLSPCRCASSVTEAASAIIAVSDNNIAQAMRVVSTSKGLDPADYTLVAYGGAGPLLADSVAEELGISRILVPAGPGILCAFGVLTKDIAMDLSISRLMTDAGEQFTEAVHVFDDLQNRAQTELAESGANVVGIDFYPHH